jgi:hypothetical protein
MKAYTLRVGSKIVGKVKGKEYIKIVSASKHFLRHPRAIAFDLECLSSAEGMGAIWVRVDDRESRMTYKANIDLIRKAGFKLDRGYGKQIALPLNMWIRTPFGEPEQLSMF